MPVEEWPANTYPPMPHGPGYLINLPAAAEITQLHERKAIKVLRLEDVSMGVWLDHLKTQLGWTVNYRHSEKFMGSATCRFENYITHYIKPPRMRCMWEEEQKDSGRVCTCN